MMMLRYCAPLPCAQIQRLVCHIFTDRDGMTGYLDAGRRSLGGFHPTTTRPHYLSQLHHPGKYAHFAKGRAPSPVACAATKNVDSGDSNVHGDSGINGIHAVVQSVRKFVKEQFVPIGLMTGVAAGLFAPEAGAAAAQLGLSSYTTTGIFILSGLSLKRSEGLAALSSMGAFSYGLLSILAITPLAAMLVLSLPLQPVALAVGLAVFCAMPTTLSTGIALTQTVGGNNAMALLLTLSSNMLAVLTVPFLLPYLLGPVAGGVQLESVPLLVQLVKTVLCPTLFGVACRSLIPGLAGVIDNNKRLVSIASTVMLSTVPWMQISAASMQNVTVSPMALMGVVSAGVAVHIGYLLFNSSMVNMFNLGGSGPGSTGIKRAVILVSSQKTLPVAVAVLAQLSGILGDQMGLAALSCVFCHLGQNLIDSYLVARWLQADKAKKLLLEQEEQKLLEGESKGQPTQPPKLA